MTLPKQKERGFSNDGDDDDDDDDVVTSRRMSSSSLPSSTSVPHTPSHLTSTSPTPAATDPPAKVTRGLNGGISVHEILPLGDDAHDLNIFFTRKEQQIRNILTREVVDRRAIRVVFSIVAEFSKYVTGKENSVVKQTTVENLSIPLLSIYAGWEIDSAIEDARRGLRDCIEEFVREGSGWIFDRIIRLEMSIVGFNPLAGSGWIELPEKLKRKQAIINIKNTDNRCFLYSVLAHIYPEEHNPSRCSHYIDKTDRLNMDGIRFPVELRQIPLFERMNRISINVLGYSEEDDDIFPLYCTSLTSAVHEVNLLLLSNEGGHHYCLIRGDAGLSRLVSNRSKHKHRTYVCHYCLHPFSSDSRREAHKPYCSPHGPQKAEMVDEDNKIMKFRNYFHGLRCPFTIYCDFEAILKKVDTCLNNPESSSTTDYEQHEVCGFAYMVVCADPKLTQKPVLYRGPNAVQKFLEMISEEEKKINQILSNPIPMVMTRDDYSNFHRSNLCHVCEKPMIGDDKCRDHDHLTGQYRGACHLSCNLNYKFRRSTKNGRFMIPCVFHNLKGYDAHHLVVGGLGSMCQKVTCIARNMESYLSITRDSIRFIDSLQFLNESLANLVDNLKQSGVDKFKLLKQFFPADKLDLLMRKGVFPYGFLSSMEKFSETSLPAKSEFFNELIGEPISDDDYIHAQAVWDAFSMRTFGDYHDLYLKTDVVLLADVFEFFRTTCLSFYRIDPCHYISAPGVSWDAMLRMTQVEIELLTDPDMYCFIEKGVRGGVSVISHRFARANNSYLENYDSKKNSSYIISWDMNNLYGCSMSEPLPIRNFRWLSQDEIQSLNLSTLDDNAKEGYIYECDLRYNPQIHDCTSEYPLAPEKLTVTHEMLSPYSRAVHETVHCTEESYIGTEKLIPNLKDKLNYVVHYRNLKFYADQGMIIQKIHRVLTFEQEPWLKPYIDFNTSKRKDAKNEFEKQFFKLLNNAVFGKTLESVRKRQNIHLVNDEKRLRKLCSKPHLKTYKLLNPNLAAVHLNRVKVILNRPIFVGFTVLDHSKLLMFSFHYMHVKAKYGTKAKLLFTDTDSLTYFVETEDIYRDMLMESDLYDFSAYPPTHPCFSLLNKKALGKMKDEFHSVPLLEFVGLRSKMYSLTDGTHEKKTAKGIQRIVTEKCLSHQLYKDCLFEMNVEYAQMRRIGSRNHQLYSIIVNKKALSPFDDKRFILDNGVDTLAHGHYRIDSILNDHEKSST